jgi:hypothetical protein
VDLAAEIPRIFNWPGLQNAGADYIPVISDTESLAIFLAELEYHHAGR